MSKEDAARLRMLAVDVNETDASILERVASQLESDAKRDEQYEALQATGKSAYEAIADMVVALECDYDRLEYLKSGLEAEGLIDADARLELHDLQVEAGECTNLEDAERFIQEDPLSVQVRGGWVSIGEQENLNAPEEFEILLGTGGPATRIIGELNEHGEPTRARLQAQDWGTVWTDYRGGDSDTLLAYCRCFCFGES